MTWTQRLKRVFGIEIEQCERCGGTLKIIACIETPEVIAQILDHLQRRSAPPKDLARVGRRRSGAMISFYHEPPPGNGVSDRGADGLGLAAWARRGGRGEGNDDFRAASLETICQLVAAGFDNYATKRKGDAGLASPLQRSAGTKRMPA